MRSVGRVLFFSFLSALALASGCMRPESPENAGDGLESALDSQHYFTLKNLEGESVSLKEVLKVKKAVLVNFFATWCPPCREEIPDLIELQQKNSGRGFTVLGIDPEESQAKVSSFSRKMGVNYPVLLYEDASAAMAYGIVGVPTTFLIGSDGKLLGEYHSFTRKLVSDVEKALR